MNKPIIHIGYPKTGTKWFQKYFYPIVDDSCFINRDQVSDLIIYPDVFSYNPLDTYSKINLLSQNKRVLICEELLLGGLDIAYGSGEFISQIASRLKETFSEAEIIIFIRNQHDALESAYSHYIKSGGTYSVEKYLGLNDRFKHKFQNYHLFNPNLLMYVNVIELYIQLFGESNVHVYFYEDFVSHPDVFVADFCKKHNLTISSQIDFNSKENIRLSSASVKTMRFLNHFTHRNTPFKNYIFKSNCIYFCLVSLTNYIDNSVFFKGKKFKFNNDIHKWITIYFSNNNKRLSNIVDYKKLEKYNYPL